MVLYKRNCIVASSIKLRGDQLLADLSRVLVGKRIVSVTGSCFAGGRSFRPNCRECLSESGYTQDKDSPVRFSSSDGSVKPPKNASRCKTVVAGDTNKKTLDFEIDDGTKLSFVLRQGCSAENTFTSSLESDSRSSKKTIGSVDSKTESRAIVYPDPHIMPVELYDFGSGVSSFDGTLKSC